MSSAQFSPLERNLATGELFLHLLSPHSTIILTPLRLSDTTAITAIMNDPAVHPWLGCPNNIFTLEEVHALVNEYIRASDMVIHALKESTALEGITMNFLTPTHHHCRLITIILATVLKQWAILCMHVHHLHISVFTGNAGSMCVFEKNEFGLSRTVENCIEIQGDMRSLHVLDWKHVE
ncbi:hypothetical protein B0H14DRAFT_3435561 [Mycena olivaceomarginata]|nr:hypothetical protein B0H14DRAFT_3435561 [Mycena olivaceomarginata]